jgi:hypothetical protein
VAGETVTAALLNTHVRDNLKALGDAWQSYTPTWTAVTTNPTLGNGTLAGAYVQVGKLVVYRIRLNFGSTTSIGSGVYSWTLPVTVSGAADYLGGAFCFNGSGTRRPRHALCGSSTTVQLCDDSGARTDHSNTLAWASGFSISISGTYEAA